MNILTIRTENPKAELGIYASGKKQAYETWQAHTKLAETLNQQIRKILERSSISFDELQGIVLYGGPGSFTGLRIGASVANALAYSFNIPVVSVGGPDWQRIGIKKIQSGENQKIVVPTYGSEPKTTMQRK